MESFSQSSVHIDAEFKSLIPPLSAEERAQLEANISADGCRDPLVLWGTILIDGHNRYEICTELGIAFDTVQRAFADRDEAQLWIIYNQFGRRNLSAFVRAELALLAKDAIARKAKANQVVRKGDQRGTTLENSTELSKPVDTRQEIALLAGVSDNTIARVQKIQETASEETKADLRSGAISINEAYLQITGKAKSFKADKPESIEEKFEPQQKKEKTFDADARGDKICDWLRHELDQWPQEHLRLALHWINQIITKEFKA